MLFKIVQSKKIVIINFVVIAVAAILFGREYIRNEKRFAVLPTPPTSELIQEGLTEAENGIIPQRLIIPRIDVNAAVQHVGVSVSGNMQAPTYYKDVAWYQYGAMPGAKGNSVIAGHFDTIKNREAVFFRLNELEIGDEIIVLDEDGNRLIFIVREKIKIEYDSRDKEILNKIFGPSERVGLNLITCDGVWVPEQKTYSDRLVLFAELKI